MSTLLLVLAGVLVVAAFVGGIFVGRATMGSITPALLPPTAVAEDKAAQQALDTAKENAEKVKHESDAAVRDRVERLRERGRAGE